MMTRRLCDWLTDKIMKNTTVGECKKESINYGLRILVFEAISTSTSLIIGMLLGLIFNMIITVLVFGTLRVLAGGAHCITRCKCFVMYNTIIWGTIFASKLVTFKLPIVLMAIITIVVFWIYAPGDNQKKPIRRKKKRLVLKLTSIAAALLIYLVAGVVNGFDRIIANILLISSINVTFLLTPIGYRLCQCYRGYIK